MAEADTVPHVSVVDVAPRRSPGLLSRVFSILVRADQQVGPQPQLQETTQTAVVGSSEQRRYDQYFRTGFDRYTVYNDVEEMDLTSEEASIALDTIADNATTSERGGGETFKVITKNAQVQSILDEIVQRCDLHDKVYSIVRQSYKYGDIFMEVVYNNDLEISNLRILNPKSMHRNEDKFGTLAFGAPRYDPETGECLNQGGECAFEQRDIQTQKLVATFWPYQIIHGRWNWDGISKYGQSGLRVTRLSWKKLHAEEESLIMGRLIRAMMKLAFYVDTTGKTLQEKNQILRDFQDQIMKHTQLDSRRDTPWSVMSDFFFSADHYKIGGQVVESKTRVEAIDPKNDGLTNINDIEHFHRKVTSTTRVPRTHMGFDKESLPAGTVTIQDVQYIRLLRRLQNYTSNLMKTLFDAALILADIDPKADGNEYHIEWPSLSAVNEAAAADAEYKTAQAAALLLGTNAQNQTPVVTPKWVMKNLLQMNDDEVAELMDDLEQVKQDRLKQASVELAMKTKAQAELARQQAQHQAAMAPPSPNAPSPAGTDHTQAADPEKVKQGSNTAERVTQEEFEIPTLTSLLLSRIRARISEPLDTVRTSQNLILEELREFNDGQGG